MNWKTDINSIFTELDAKHFKLRELAEKTNTSASTLSRIKNNKIIPNVELYYKLAQLANLRITLGNAVSQKQSEGHR